MEGEIRKVEDVGMSDTDSASEAEAELIPLPEPTIVNVVESGMTFQEWHTQEMVDRYHQEDADDDEIKSLACSLEDEFGEVLDASKGMGQRHQATTTRKTTKVHCSVSRGSSSGGGTATSSIRSTFAAERSICVSPGYKYEPITAKAGAEVD